MPKTEPIEELSRLNNELANLQRAVEQKNAELTRLANMQREMLGMAAHDLRSPLSVIREFAGFLLREETTEEQRHKLLRSIERNADVMVRIIDDLLDITRAQTGELQLNCKPVDLADVVQKSAELHQPIAAGKSIHLRVETQPCDPVPIDAARIDQVLANLLSNAIHFSKPHTDVIVRLECAENEVVVSVTDYGPGIPTAEQHRLFKPFGRTSTKKTGKEPSTGLGLAISKRIVEAHDGRIWCDSEPGRGSTFAFALSR